MLSRGIRADGTDGGCGLATFLGFRIGRWRIGGGTGIEGSVGICGFRWGG